MTRKNASAQGIEEENHRLTRRIQILQTTLDHIGTYVFLKDTEGRYTYANKLVCELFGFPLEEIVGHDDSKFFSLDISDDIRKNDRIVMERGKTIENEERNVIASTGETRYYKTVKKPLKDSEGNITGMFGVSTDITELSLLRNKLQDEVQEEITKRLKQEQLAITDPLTGLYNRIKLDESLEYELHRTRRFQHGFGIILLDIDQFKAVNDTYGHQVGDKVLVEIANVLRKNVRKTDTIGRWGGEEFLIVSPEAKEEGLINIAEKLRCSIEQHKFSIVKHKTASLGIAVYRNGESIRELVFRADAALYRAKRKGRNCVESSTSSPDSNSY